MTRIPGFQNRRRVEDKWEVGTLVRISRDPKHKNGPLHCTYFIIKGDEKNEVSHYTHPALAALKRQIKKEMFIELYGGNVKAILGPKPG